MDAKRLIFVCGTHRSGTSLLHRLVRAHPLVSGFANTGVPEDEGQHLQYVYPAAGRLGGPGRFAFSPLARMDEAHPLASAATADRLYGQWARHWDLSKPFLVEKSPPNVVRTRFLQALFPGAAFLCVVRHPVPVAYSTIRMGRGEPLPAMALVRHTLHCYEVLLRDLSHLARAMLLRYEDLVADPLRTWHAICDFAGLDRTELSEPVRPDANDGYFRRWEQEGARPDAVWEACEQAARPLGYTLRDPYILTGVPPRLRATVPSCDPGM